MLTNFLIKKFIPKSKDNLRKSYGYLGGSVGIIANIILFLSKFFIGLALNSVAISADAFNNLSDVGSSVITIIGFKIADKPADKDHPFGHGRGEYIAGLVVSFLVLYVGFQFIKSSIERIIHPVSLTFTLVSFGILILSIVVKLWLGSFNKRLAKDISSETLNASSFDSFSDVIVTSTVALSLLLSRFTALPLDGYIGVVVSLFILFAGYNLVRDTISPLLGEAPPAELVKSIIAEAISYEGITGVHDLIVHSYGAENYIATIHAEMPSDIPVLDAHEIVDKAEMEISKKLGILLIIHMDPVNVDDKEIVKTRNQIEELLKEFPEIKSIHDFRFVGKDDHKNILFDIVVGNELPHKAEDTFIVMIQNRVKSVYPNYNLIISLDRDYL